MTSESIVTETANDSPADELEVMQAVSKAMDSLDQDARQRVWDWVTSKFSLRGVGGTQSSAAGAAGVSPLTAGVPAAYDISALTPKQFLALKKPKTDIERMTCLAYYLTNARGENHFGTRELTDLNTEAAGARFSNPSYTARDATNRNGYLAPAGQGLKQITPLGEEIVEAMPDRDAVDSVISQAPRRRRRKATRKTGGGHLDE
jgi:hypothetical protein